MMTRAKIASNKTKSKKSPRSLQKKSNGNIDSKRRPNFYTQYPWSPVPDMVQYFVGREVEFMEFWNQMAKLVGAGTGKKFNYAFVGQRKLGKTAYLKRCYNIAFWEQNQVVPFYYSFAQHDSESEFTTQVKSLQNKMPMVFISQFLSFCSKDETYLKLHKIEDIFVHMRKTKLAKCEELIRSIQACWSKIYGEQDATIILENIWELTQVLSFFVDKKCFLIIDEAQQMDISIYDGDKPCRCKGSIADIIQKDHSLVFVSGSNVSMLVNQFLDPSFANRLTQQTFSTLEIDDAEDLVHRICPNGYKNLANDLVNYVGGNPYYIEIVLDFNIDYYKEFKQDKDFSSPQGLQKAYNFEVLHPKGKLYRFWRFHIHKNQDDLNRDTKGKKGLTLQILYRISKQSENYFPYSQLMSEFKIDEKTLMSKIQQLENANFIEAMGPTRLAHGFPDKILPVIINNFYHELILQGPNKTVAQEARQDMLATQKAFADYQDIQEFVEEHRQEIEDISRDMPKLRDKIFDLRFRKLEIEKGIKAAKGKLSLSRGAKRENKVRKKIHQMIQKSQKRFADYKLQGHIHSVNIRSSQGTGCEIDVFAELKKKRSRKGKKQLATFSLLAEVKDRKTAVSMEEAKKFIATIQLAIREYKLKDVRSVYISTSGFRSCVEEYLESQGVEVGDSERIFDC